DPLAEADDLAVRRVRAYQIVALVRARRRFTDVRHPGWWAHVRLPPEREVPRLEQHLLDVLGVGHRGRQPGRTDSPDEQVPLVGIEADQVIAAVDGSPQPGIGGGDFLLEEDRYQPFAL